MAAKKAKSPAFDIGQILRLQSQLSGPTWLDFYGITLRGDDFEEFARCAHADLPKGVPFPAVYTSLQPFAGQDLTPEMGDEAAWRLAGNLHRLKKKIPVYPWKGQIEEEEAPVVVEGVNLATRIFKREGQDEHVRGGWVKLLFLGGLPAGRRIVRFWSWKFAKYSKVGIGFSRWDRSKYTDDKKRLKTNYPLVHMRQIVQLRFLVGLEADRDPGGPKIVGDQVRATPAMKLYNHSILARRLRRDGFECPMAWDRECHLCPIGYEKCRAACHRLDYVGKHCEGCAQDNRPFDPDSPSAICVDCTATQV